MVFLQHTARHAKGYTIEQGPQGVKEAETLQCSHCEAILEIGPEHQWGWCFKCNAPTCNKKKCRKDCKPWEQQMEEIEYKARMEQNLRVLRK